MGLNDYLQEHVLKPLDLHNINMFPTDSMKANLASMTQRWPGSSISETRDQPYRAPLIAETPEERKAVFNSAGAGCFAKPREYVRESNHICHV